MNIYFEFAMYGAAIMLILTFIIGFIRNKSSPNLNIIPNTLFGVVFGGVGRLLFDEIMREIYPLAPTLTIVCLYFLGLWVLTMAISILLRRNSH